MRDLRGKLAGSEGYALRKLAEVRYVVIHHSGVAGDQDAEVIAAWHVDQLGWPGIGYHFLIHEDGAIDYVGDIATVRYNVAGRNREVVGICIPGDFTSECPNELQIGAARNLVRVLRPLLDPEETGGTGDGETGRGGEKETGRRGDEEKRRLRAVGHREVALPGYETSCPGETWREWGPIVAEG